MAGAPSAVLFDLDGVLVKSEEAWFLTLAEAGRRFRGRAVSPEEFQPTFGQGTAADAQAFGLSCTPAELDRFYGQEFVRHLRTVWVNPDAQPLLKGLQARGIGVRVVTHTLGSLAGQLLEDGRPS